MTRVSKVYTLDNSVNRIETKKKTEKNTTTLKFKQI